MVHCTKDGIQRYDQFRKASISGFAESDAVPPVRSIDQHRHMVVWIDTKTALDFQDTLQSNGVTAIVDKTAEAVIKREAIEPNASTAFIAFLAICLQRLLLSFNAGLERRLHGVCMAAPKICEFVDINISSNGTESRGETEQSRSRLR